MDSFGCPFRRYFGINTMGTRLGRFSNNKQGKDMNNEFLRTEEAIVAALKTVYDPEIPVNVYDLGLIYCVDVDEEKNVRIDMTLTAPGCPAADYIMEDVRMKVESVEGVVNVEINLVFEPEWHRDMMSDEAKLDLGFL
jgi:FeS assembly SUF system protein